MHTTSQQEASETMTTNITNPHSSHITKRDVLSGRDSLAKHHPGNHVFKSLVKKNRATYQSLQSNHHKALLAESIVTTVQKGGGRFMRRQTTKTKASTPTSTARGESPAQNLNQHPLDEWIELTPKEAMAKTTQALREIFGTKSTPLSSSSSSARKNGMTPFMANGSRNFMKMTTEGSLQSMGTASSVVSSSKSSSSSPETVPYLVGESLSPQHLAAPLGWHGLGYNHNIIGQWNLDFMSTQRLGRASTLPSVLPQPSLLSMTSGITPLERQHLLLFHKKNQPPFPAPRLENPLMTLSAAASATARMQKDVALRQYVSLLSREQLERLVFS